MASMKTKQPRIVLLMDTNRAYERGLLRGILKYSRLHGPLSFWRKQNVVSGGPKEITLDMIKEWNPDGIIWREGYEDLNIQSLGLPTIYAPFTQPDPHLLNVVSDDAGIGAKAADHLLRRGFRNFAYYGLSDRCYFSQDRKASFARTVEKAGFKAESCNKNNLCKLTEWISGLTKPLGMMVSNDDCAVDCYDAIRKLNLRIPDDVAIIGVGNDELVCDFAHPPLSSVAMNTEHAGYEIARALVDMIAGSHPTEDIVSGALEVVERQSTNIFAIRDKLISKAIQFIYSNIGKNLHVNDVVNAIPLSRRALYNRFKQAIGRSIYEEIRHAKMDYAARMLMESNLSITEIAEKLGFSDAKNLARVFQKGKGMTPFKYRMQYSPYK